MREKLIQQLEAFRPYNEQEERDRQQMLDFLKHDPDAFERSNLMAHMTASAWVVDENRSHVLMVYHNIYDSWSWLGGHADGETDLLAVAVREVMEEAGIRRVRPLSEDIYSLEILTVDGHVKNGSYVSGHLHYNVTYLLEADADQPLQIKADENSGAAWFEPEAALAASTEPWFVDHIYTKLINKMK